MTFSRKLYQFCAVRNLKNLILVGLFPLTVLLLRMSMKCSIRKNSSKIMNFTALTTKQGAIASP
jgi:hypothetical protein